MLYDQPIWEMIPKQVLLLLIFQLERNINVMSQLMSQGLQLILIQASFDSRSHFTAKSLRQRNKQRPGLEWKGESERREKERKCVCVCVSVCVCVNACVFVCKC